MGRLICIVSALILVISASSGCKEKKKPQFVDMDTIRTDGSHDDRTIFRKEIEKEEQRDKRYKKDEF